MTIGAILKAPMLVHGLVAAFLFINVIAYHGILNQAMQVLGIWDEPRRLRPLTAENPASMKHSRSLVTTHVNGLPPSFYRNI